ncbi:hypothetical protein [Aromatoleum evansii]|uniref:hypothetical protein n=1 Tax=Aromatoleum evansii TaxID=59406 RepID=UPI00145D869C|nr:hypothetical protein [Aromatoleum evansii]NMG28758.1 hypothetical protein [Aromatoleum evansii]
MARNDPGARDSAALRGFPGRVIVRSPDWRDDHAHVLFDVNSGDYWIVSSLACEIVKLSTRDGPSNVESLIQHLVGHGADSGADDVDETTIRRVIDELVQLAILAHT